MNEVPNLFFSLCPDLRECHESTREIFKNPLFNHFHHTHC